MEVTHTFLLRFSRYLLAQVTYLPIPFFILPQEKVSSGWFHRRFAIMAKIGAGDNHDQTTFIIAKNGS